jgi:phosphoribosylaminoimidazole-succinocarboxamide synthase
VAAMAQTALTPLAEGKTKRLFPLEGEPGNVLVEFKDKATAFNAVKVQEVAGKGALNATISAHLFSFLNACDAERIPTCFVRMTDQPNVLVYRSLRMIPLEVVVRNVAFGSLCKRYPVFQEGQALARPVVEFFWKDNEAGDPLLSEEIIPLMNLLPRGVSVAHLKAFALRVNAYLVDYFQSLGVVCADFKLEFGVDDKGRLVLGDEMSPDNFRLRDAQTGEVLDKDVFRLDLGDIAQAYGKLLSRIQERTQHVISKPVGERRVYEAAIWVGLRPNVLHPESRTIFEALHTFGFQEVTSLRAARLFTLQVQAAHVAEAEQVLEKIAADVLSNPVIERYEIRTLEPVLA